MEFHVGISFLNIFRGIMQITESRSIQLHVKAMYWKYRMNFNGCINILMSIGIKSNKMEKIFKNITEKNML